MKRILLWYCLLLTTIMNAQESGGQLTNLGHQLSASMIQGSIFIEDKAGKEWLYTVVRGEPAHLLGYELKSGKIVLDQPLPGADGAWDLAWSPDGWLYVPGASGFLFRHQPGTDIVENLGMALEGETYVWSLTTGKNGEIFGATYPGCRVFRFHPNDGFSDAGKGPLVQGENYVRSLAYHPGTGKLYAGVGSHAHLLELDPKSGKKTEMLPEVYRSKEFAYGVELASGVKGGDRLLVLLTSGQLTLVYNLRTRRVERELKGIDMKSIIQEKNGNRIYYTQNGALYRLDLSRPSALPERITETIGTALSFHWHRSGNLRVITSAKKLYDINPVSRKSTVIDLEVPGQPIPIQSMIKGPDGRIWMGGYLAGGNAAYDPATGTTTAYSGLDQTEGMAVDGSKIYFGVYPKGKYYVYDARKPWDPKTNNPAFIGEIDGQSRAFAVQPVPALKKVYFGTVPEYGQLGGALVEHDQSSGGLHALTNFVANQSIVSLLYHEELLYAGSSVSGGLGVQPSEKEAHLVVWDAGKKQKLLDMVPVPGAMAITGLMTGPGNSIWGVADGLLFVFDPQKQTVVKTQRIFDVPAVRGHIWRSAFLATHPNGQVYGTANNLLFRIDPANLQVTIIDKKAALLAMDDRGNIYFKRNTELWRYSPE